MGCDGGTIPTRDELVRLKKKPEKKERSVELAAKWKHCALTQEPLRSPMMACQLGRLYNKESVLELLLDRSKFDEGGSKFDHLRSLKDVKELQLTQNPSFKQKAECGDGYVDRHAAPFICPITGLEMSGHYRFCYLYNCCCVLSERAIKEIKSDLCHKCGVPFTRDDVIVLNADDEEMDEVRMRMEARKQLAKMEKKSKKRKTDEKCDAPSIGKQQKVASSSGGGERASTSGAKSKLVTARGGSGGQGSSRVTAAKKPLGIQNDPKASSTYKSLFNTCAEAKNQIKGHWVTYNPQYFR